MQTRVALSRRAAPARARLISIPIGGCIGRGMGAPDTLSTRHVRVSATRSCGPYEQDTGHRAVRGAEPAPNDRASTGQRDAKRGVEALNALPSDGRRFEHDQSCNGPCRPATLARDPGSKSCLAIQGRQHRLRIGHDGFRFDHEERAARRMPGKDVDGAAFGIDRERHLHGKVPAVRREQTDDRFDEACVRLVEQPIELLAAPTDRDIEPPVERDDDPFERSNRERRHPASLEVGDRPMRQTRPGTQVLLAPASADPDGAQRQAEADRIHEASMLAGA